MPVLSSFYAAPLRCFCGLGLLVAALLAFPARAQNQWTGLSASNYAGLNNVAINPSSIADTPYRLYVNIAGGNAHIFNNYLKVDVPYSLWQLTRNRVGDANRDRSGHVLFKPSYITENLDGSTKYLTVSAEARFPGVLVPLPHGQAIAFTSRARVGVQLNGASEALVRLARHGLPDAGPLGLANQPLVDSRFGLNVNSWQEFNLSYARTLTPNTRHFFKVGATVKYLVGLGGGYVINKGLGYTVYDGDSIQVRNRDVQYGYTNYQFYDRGSGYRTRNLYNKDRLGRGLGLDVGVTYEWRPDFEQYNYTMDNEARTDDMGPKYKLRLGLALVDLGRINYTNDRYVRASKLATNATAQLGSLDTLSYTDLAGVDGIVNQLVGTASTERSYKSQLPHTLNLTVDYHLKGSYYVSALWNQSLLSRYAIGIRTFSGLSIIPRFEKKKVEFSLPVAVADDYRNLRVGAMLRVGPVFIGSDNLAGLVSAGKTTGYDLYAGAAFVLFNKRAKDRDRDQVSDLVDACPDVPGVWEFKGCPDRDGDHVPDVIDECPDDAGLAQFKGCPDRDHDSIIDKLDACPDIVGIAEFKGCPDRDHDHVTDAEDRCPDVPGARDHAGCPDTDADGVFDPDDQCITVAGPAANRGCPWPDADADGTPDKDDGCPQVPGPATNKGCPALTAVEVEILKTAFDNLEFEFGKAIIRISSYPALYELANVLKAKPNYRLQLAGHTDNVGKPAANLKLSQQRAQAVAEYLAQQGVDPARFLVEGYGPTQPLDTNKTEEGRARNRRVEMTILFE